MSLPIDVLRNALSFFSQRAFVVEKGEFGPRLKVRSAWSAALTDYMNKHRIKELLVTDGPSPEDSVSDLEFLSDINELEGFASTTHRIRNYTPIYQHRELKSVSLSRGLVDPRQGFEFKALDNIERLRFGEAIPNDFEVACCKALKELSLVRLSKGFSSTSFSSLSELRYLSISNSTLSDLEGLASLSKLAEIHLFSLRKLDSLRGLEGPSVALKRVLIEGCPNLASIDSLNEATNVEFLYLFDCGDLDSAMPILRMKKLRSLTLGGNTNILDGKLAAISKLPYLTELLGVHRKHYDVCKEAFVNLRK